MHIKSANHYLLTIACTLLVILICKSSYGQKIYRKENAETAELKDKGAAHYNDKKYKEAAEYFSKATRSEQGIMVDNYLMAAKAWSMAGYPDSAFIFLNAVAAEYTDVNRVETDAAFTSLHVDSRWNAVVKRIKDNYDAKEAGYDRLLKAALDSIFHDDQDVRMRERDTSAKYGTQSAQIKSMELVIVQKDSVNVVRVKHILRTYGWPEPKKIGDNNEMTIFLVLQHAPLAVQKEYSEQVKGAYEKGYIPAAYYALFVDKLATKEAKEQTYGSQLRLDTVSNSYYVLPIADAGNVDKRRVEVGLPPMAEYLKYYNIDWSLEKYEAQLKQLAKEHVPVYPQ